MASEPYPFLSPVVKIGIEHETEPFDCGHSELNRFLKRYAVVSQKANTAQSYVSCCGTKVVAYYTLTVGSVAYQDAPERITKGLARYPVPLMILARLAVDKTLQGKGVGAALLKNAMMRTYHASEIAGIRAIFVHAKDEKAKRFYEHFNFRHSPTDPHHLFCLMKDIHRLIVG